MTVIAMVKTENGIIAAADSRETFRDDKTGTVIRHGDDVTKLFRWRSKPWSFLVVTQGRTTICSNDSTGRIVNNLPRFSGLSPSPDSSVQSFADHFARLIQTSPPQGTGSDSHLNFLIGVVATSPVIFTVAIALGSAPRVEMQNLNVGQAIFGGSSKIAQGCFNMCKKERDWNAAARNLRAALIAQTKVDENCGGPVLVELLTKNGYEKYEP